MKTYHVGGLNPIHRFKTLSDALKKVQDDDTIILHKNVDEYVKIDKNIILDGHNHTVNVNKGKVGFHITSQCEIHNLNFKAQARSNALVATKGVYLDHVKTELIGPIREFYSVVIFQGSSKVTADNCDFTNVNVANTVNATFNDSNFSSYYKGDISLTTRSDMSIFNGNVTMNDCTLKSCIFAGQTQLNGCVLDRYIDIDSNNTVMNNCVINMHEDKVKKNEYKKEPSSGPLSHKIDNKYCIAVRPNGSITVNNLTIDGARENFLGFYAKNGTINLNSTNLSDLGIKNRIVDSNLSLHDTHDKNYWQIDGNSPTAYVRSDLNASRQYETAMQKLDKLIGQDNVKHQIKTIMNTIQMQSNTNNKDFDFSYNMIFAGAPGSGKAEPLTATIHTPQGIRRFGDLKVGDYVFDRTGAPTKILGTYPQGKKDVYRVTLKDGRSMICNDEHLFTVLDTKHRKRGMKTMTLRKMLDHGIDFSNFSHGKMHTHKRWEIPTNEAVQMPDKILPLDPYVLGVLLGDGALTCKNLTISSADPFVIHKVARTLHVRSNKYSLKNYNWNFKYYNSEQYNRFVVHTNDIVPKELQNVKSIDRFIPEEYKNASINQRLALLQGLFDTDGSITKAKGRYRIVYSTNSKQLALDVRELMFSLGLGNSMDERMRNEDFHKNKEYAIRALVDPLDKPLFFTLPKKLRKAREGALRKSTRNYNFEIISNIEKLNYQEEMMCIYVDNPEHLYLSNEFIVTHNTTIARIVAQALFEVGAIPENKITMATSDEFVKGYIGQSGENTRRILDKALGGVLFIDEAYQLTVKPGEKSFNSDVLSVLIRYMEDHRSDLVVIAAGYNKEMKEFLASNVGLTRRFQWIQFNNYTNKELAEIFELMRHSYGDKFADPKLELALEPLFTKLTNLNLSIPDANGRRTNGGNGGLVRNVYQAIAQARNNRVATTGGDADFTQSDVAQGFQVEINKAENRKM